jgi:hypothetical protein
LICDRCEVHWTSKQKNAQDYTSPIRPYGKQCERTKLWCGYNSKQRSKSAVVFHYLLKSQAFHDLKRAFQLETPKNHDQWLLKRMTEMPPFLLTKKQLVELQCLSPSFYKMLSFKEAHMETRTRYMDAVCSTQPRAIHRTYRDLIMRAKQTQWGPQKRKRHRSTKKAKKKLNKSKKSKR